MPKPKTVKVECDTCGLDWKQHKPNAKGTVPLTECVRLLKDALTAAKSYRNPYPFFGGAGTVSNVTARGIPLN